jgi:hypothetical protein
MSEQLGEQIDVVVVDEVAEIPEGVLSAPSEEPTKLFNDDKVIVKGLLSKVLGKATAFYSKYIVVADQLDINQLITTLNNMMSADIYDLLNKVAPVYVVHEGSLKLVNAVNRSLMIDLGDKPAQVELLDTYVDLMIDIVKQYE